MLRESHAVVEGRLVAALVDVDAWRSRAVLAGARAVLAEAGCLAVETFVKVLDLDGVVVGDSGAVEGLCGQVEGLRVAFPDKFSPPRVAGFPLAVDPGSRVST